MKDRIALPPLDHISYSHLHILACPYAAFLRYDAQIRGPVTPWLALGNAIHLVLEIVYKEQDFNIKNWVKTFTSEFKRIINEDEVFIGYPQMRKLESDGISMLETYYDQVKAGIISKVPLEVEKEFRIPIAGTELVGRIDKIENDFSVVDYKTGKSKPDPWFLRHNLQMTAYYWAIFEIYGKYPKDIYWHHLRTGELLRTERTPQDIDHLKRMIEDVVKMREEGIRHRIFHEQICGYCDYTGAVCDDTELEDKVVGNIAK